MSAKETKTTAAEAVAEAKKVDEAVAYVGPNIKGVAINGTVYTNGVPEKLQEKMAEIPAIKGLLIPVSKLATAGVAIQKEGTALNTLYKTVAAKLQ